MAAGVMTAALALVFVVPSHTPRAAAASNSPDVLTATGPFANGITSGELEYETDQNLWLDNNGGEVTWGAFAPCQLTGEAVTFSNGSSAIYPSSTTGVTAPPGVAVDKISVGGDICTNTIGAIGIAATPDGGGYYVADNDQEVYAYGDAEYGQPMTAPPADSSQPPAVAVAEETVSNGSEGYLTVTAKGIVTASGAEFYGSITTPLNQPIVGIAVTPDNQGYWLVASDGGVFAFGDAQYYGGMGGKHLNQPIVGMAADDATGGYWLVAADGGIFSFNAPFYGSTGNIVLNKPIIGMEAAPNGSGYRFVASDGGVFCFNLPFVGSLGANPPASPIEGLAPSGTNGYWLVEHDGTVQAFGSAPLVSLQPNP
jgi:hypothetical protein